MTYFAFHLVFVIPPIVLLAWLGRRQPLAGIGGQRARLALPLIVLIALVYTTPWDNYLVWRGIWEYGSDRVVGTIGYVPVEEYLFFLLQSILTGLWLYWLLACKSEPLQQSSLRLRVLMLMFGVILSIAGFLMLRWDSTLYLGLVLAWAAPVLSLQWILGAPTLWAMKRIWLMGVLVPTLYLWVADRIAIGNGIWQIADRYTTGLELFGLPIEEATFFLVTNLLVVQGISLFLFLKMPHSVAKLQHIRSL
jgi:lycopene cyclase domain-containing protein